MRNERLVGAFLGSLGTVSERGEGLEVRAELVLVWRVRLEWDGGPFVD